VNILLLSLLAVILMSFLAIFVIMVGGWATWEDSLWFYPTGFVLLLGLGFIYTVNRYWSGQWASVLLLLLITGAIAFTDDPLQVIEGRSLFMFTFSIFLASVLVRPYASFVMVVWVGVLLGIVGWSARLDAEVLGSLPFTLLVFVLFALVAWLSAHSLEKAIKDLRALNIELDQRVTERTWALADALTSAYDASGQLHLEVRER